MTDGVRRLNCSEILQHQFWGIHIFSDIIYQQICTHTIQSASTLQPLTGKVKNTDQFVPMQCASGKPMVLAIMWMQLWHAEQVQTPHGNGIPRWHCPHAGQCATPHGKNCSGMAQEMKHKPHSVDPASSFCRSQFDQALMGHARPGPINGPRLTTHRTRTIHSQCP